MWCVQISRDVPWNALSFVFFMAFRSSFKYFTNTPPTDSVNALLGAAGGALAACLTHPIDVIKTRIMTAPHDSPVPPSIMGAIHDLAREEGWGALGKGLLPRLLYLSPLASIMFSTREFITGLFLTRRKGNLARAIIARIIKSPSSAQASWAARPGQAGQAGQAGEEGEEGEATASAADMVSILDVSPQKARKIVADLDTNNDQGLSAKELVQA